MKINKTQYYRIQLMVVVLFSGVLAAPSILADNSMDIKSKCIKMTPVSELLPQSQSVIYGNYLSKHMAPYLGGGLLSAIADGSVWVFYPRNYWGDITNIITKQNEITAIGSSYRISEPDPNKSYLIFGIRDEDYTKYYDRPREPKSYYSKVLFPFPCGGIREATRKDLEIVKNYFKDK